MIFSLPKAFSMLILEYPRPLRKTHFLKRYKRFFVDVEVDSATETVHCANSGSMRSCLVAGAEAYTLDSLSETRKLRHSLELLRLDDGLACVNTSRANEFVEQMLLATIGKKETAAFAQAGFPYSLFAPFDHVKREAKYNAATRFDFCLSSSQSEQKFWIEVKSVSLRLDAQTWAFPDAVTERGQKHLNELMHAKQNDDRAALFFVLMRGNDIDPDILAKGFRAAHEIDPTYAALLEKAKSVGVDVYLVIPHITVNGFALRKMVVHV